VASGQAEVIQPFNTTLQFNTGTWVLDKKAQEDIKSIVSATAPGDRLTVLGYADNQGSASLSPTQNQQLNRELSRQRAQEVAQLLEQNGREIMLFEGLGEKYPLESNDTEEGRQKNRRVEVWVQRVAKPKS
jgi:phosphate transport system substrate-binding protein